MPLPWLGDHSRVAIWQWRTSWRCVPVYEVSSTPSVLAARTPDAVPNHPGSINVQRAANVRPSHCVPCISSLGLVCPSLYPTTMQPPPVVTRPPSHSRFATPSPTPTLTEDSHHTAPNSSCQPLHVFQHNLSPPSYYLPSYPYSSPVFTSLSFLSPQPLRRVGMRRFRRRRLSSYSPVVLYHPFPHPRRLRCYPCPPS